MTPTANTAIVPGREKAVATVVVDMVVVVLNVMSSVDDTSDIQRPVKRIEEIGGL